MEINFSGKRALVTGATKGIGRDIAIQLSKCGAEVIAVGRNKNDLLTLQKEVPRIVPLELDITDWKQTEKALKNIGQIDLLVNNAGMGWLKSMMDITEEDIDSVMGVNIKSLIHVTQIAIKNMLDRKVPGSIVNLSSQASMVGLLHHTVYCASKAAVDGFTRAAALEYGPHNIRINAVNPTVILTDMGKLGWSDPKVAKPMIEKIPLRRFGEVREVTDAVLYLLSDKSSMITGMTLPIDGGFTAC
ncbi:L-xylulose reductase-like [Diabrotica undecimpunctata]|uniref:L-xylulose reductase-like n=1 Tax=Diabrotica undecimpunctata TaxID=50387 RepID=UPI003B639461